MKIFVLVLVILNQYGPEHYALDYKMTESECNIKMKSEMINIKYQYPNIRFGLKCAEIEVK